MNHSESISHTVSVPLQTTLGTLEEIACWVHLLSTPPGGARNSASRSLKTDLGPKGPRRGEKEKGLSLFFFQTFKLVISFGANKTTRSQGASLATQGPQRFSQTPSVCSGLTEEKLVDLSGQALVNKNTSMWGTANAQGLSVLSCSARPPFWSLLPEHCKLLTTENVVKLF